eukprot:4468712-Prymnesium_polylepis.2
MFVGSAPAGRASHRHLVALGACVRRASRGLLALLRSEVVRVASNQTACVLVAFRPIGGDIDWGLGFKY